MPSEIGAAPENRTVNGFFCMGCNSLILSLYTHDYKVCKCGNMADGGNSYIRRGYTDFEAYRQVVEIFDWSGILRAAELGLAEQLIELGESEWLQDPGIKQLIKEERLIFTSDAKEPEDSEQKLGFTVIDDLPDDPTEAELIAEQARKEARDRKRATEIAAKLHSLSLGGENN